MRRRAWLATRLFTKPGACKDKLEQARSMRKEPTGGEAALWTELRGRRLGGWKFRRQQVIAGYIVDFYCAELRLAIEVDGAVHGARRAEDEQRDDDLGALGLGVLRVRDADVLARRGEVLRTIAARCDSIAQQSGLQRRHGSRAPKR
jgi:ATP-dependent DNA helicase RecQ